MNRRTHLAQLVVEQKAGLHLQSAQLNRLPPLVIRDLAGVMEAVIAGVPPSEIDLVLCDGVVVEAFVDSQWVR